MGKILIILGLMVVLVGVIIQFAPQAFSWFGKLPGDIRYEKREYQDFLSFDDHDPVECGNNSVAAIFGK